MTNIIYDGQSISLNDNETVLDALLRNDHSIPYGCRAGACQSCLMRTKDGTCNGVPPQAQLGLKNSQKELGYFLSCSCAPTEDLSVSRVDQSRERFQATVTEAIRINDSILRLRLKTDMLFKAGQYLNIWLDPSTIRSYSIASTSKQGFIELHIKVIPNGKFSQWAHASLQAGDTLTLQGPLGDCIYSKESSTAPLLCAGIGTGLAPLYGIIQDALEHQHQGPIQLILGAKHNSGFYLQEELIALAKQHNNLSITWVTQTLCPSAYAEFERATQTEHTANTVQRLQMIEGDVYQSIKNLPAITANHQVYLCGAQSFVTKMKKQCFLNGAAMKNIHSDAFLPCA